MNASANPVLVGGEEVAPREVALTLETGGGAAESAPDALPYGDYLVRPKRERRARGIPHAAKGAKAQPTGCFGGASPASL